MVVTTVKKKITLIGAPAVGKTSLIRKYVEGVFDEKYFSTVGTIPYKKEIKIKIDEQAYNVDLMIFDTNGTINNELFRKHTTGADGVMGVFDLTRGYTLKPLTQQISLMSLEKNTPFVVIGNKLDLVEEFLYMKALEESSIIKLDDTLKQDFNLWMNYQHKEVVEFFKREYGTYPSFDPFSLSKDENDLENYINPLNELGIDIIYTSAKTSKNVDDSFEYLARKTIENTIGKHIYSTTSPERVLREILE